MSLFAGPAEHEAAGHPSTWTITGQAGLWKHVDGLGQVHHDGGYRTRKAAREALDHGRLPKLYEALTSWYAGGPGLPGWKPYAVVAAERARNDAFQQGRAAYSGDGPRIVPRDLLVGADGNNDPVTVVDVAAAWYRGWDRAAALRSAMPDLAEA